MSASASNVPNPTPRASAEPHSLAQTQVLPPDVAPAPASPRDGWPPLSGACRCSLVSCDLVGYTTLCQDLERAAGLEASAALGRIINDYFNDAIREALSQSAYSIIHREQGDVILIAVKNEGDALAFVRALNEATRGRDARFDRDVHLFRCAIWTGEVPTAALIERHEPNNPAHGTPFNTVTRMREKAEPGHCLLNQMAFNRLLENAAFKSEHRDARPLTWRDPKAKASPRTETCYSLALRRLRVAARPRRRWSTKLFLAPCGLALLVLLGALIWQQNWFRQPQPPPLASRWHSIQFDRPDADPRAPEAAQLPPFGLRPLRHELSRTETVLKGANVLEQVAAERRGLDRSVRFAFVSERIPPGRLPERLVLSDRNLRVRAVAFLLEQVDASATWLASETAHEMDNQGHVPLSLTEGRANPERARFIVVIVFPLDAEALDKLEKERLPAEIQ